METAKQKFIPASGDWPGGIGYRYRRTEQLVNREWSLEDRELAVKAGVTLPSATMAEFETWYDMPHGSELRIDGSRLVASFDTENTAMPLPLTYQVPARAYGAWHWLTSVHNYLGRRNA